MLLKFLNSSFSNTFLKHTIFFIKNEYWIILLLIVNIKN